MHRSIYLIAALVFFALLPATASARTIADDLDAAHAYWQSDVCRGQWNVIGDATLADRGNRGEATGMGFTHNPAGGSYEYGGTRWDWHIARCEFSVHPDLTGCARYYVIAHEIGHFVHGPSHTGAMGAHGVGNVICPIEPRAEPRPRVKRTKAQIARSLRYKRQMAEIRARAAARR